MNATDTQIETLENEARHDSRWLDVMLCRLALGESMEALRETEEWENLGLESRAELGAMRAAWSDDGLRQEARRRCVAR